MTAAPSDLDDLDHAAAVGIALLHEDRGRLFAQQRAPVAAFRGDNHDVVLESAGWRELFEHRTPSVIAEAVKRACQQNTPLRVAALAFAGDPERVVRLVVQPTGTASAVAACIEISDQLMARSLGVAEWAPIWTGRSLDLDYASASFRRYVGAHSDWLHPEDLARYRNALCPAMPKTSVEVRMRRADGEYRWHRVTIAYRGARWYAAGLDIDDVFAGHLFKEQFFSAMLHDLRTPVATIALWEKLLRQHANDLALRERALDAIRCSAATQARLMTDLLDMARALDGTLRIDREPIAIETVLCAALQAAQPEAAAKGVTLVRESRQRLGRVCGDSRRLQQILAQLLANAVKYTESGGVVTIASRRQRGSIVIAVRDTGKGITSELLPQLFEPFGRDRQLLGIDSGVGISLALASMLAVLHDGALTASSPGPGLGSTFMLTLPSAQQVSTAPSLVR